MRVKRFLITLTRSPVGLIGTDCSNCHQLLVMDRPAAQVGLTAEATD